MSAFLVTFACRLVLKSTMPTLYSSVSQACPKTDNGNAILSVASVHTYSNIRVHLRISLCACLTRGNQILKCIFECNLSRHLGNAWFFSGFVFF